ncbi:unnamed protein product [Pseudo-nitzschia multistriata]|uniref:Uncharacterized protein n=1 Tax=Pseudo-nitzschia multistriata TaxID=183589 RepID=A0A448ZMN4_9STRA|nr:unnamed protein product [Pseudo-nitzschia multistriata]
MKVKQIFTCLLAIELPILAVAKFQGIVIEDDEKKFSLNLDGDLTIALSDSFGRVVDDGASAKNDSTQKGIRGTKKSKKEKKEEKKQEKKKQIEIKDGKNAKKKR